MREAGTIGGAHFIDAAFIVLKVQELAGLCFVQPVAVTPSFTTQPFIAKSIRAHVKVSGDPPDVFFGKGRGHGLAAVRTGKTIRLLPHFRFQDGDRFINAPGCIIFQLAEKPAHTSFRMTGFLAEGTKVNGLYFNHAPKILIEQICPSA